MKKIYTILLLLGLGLQVALCQPTADVAIENPRIIGNTMNFDIYIMRTNTFWSWFETADSAMISDHSWVFTYNSADLVYPPTITYSNPAIFPPGAGYTHGFFDYGFAFEVNTAGPGTVPVALRRNMELNEWVHMLTVSFTLNGTPSSLSNITWFGGGAGSAFNTIGNVANFPTTFYDSDCDIALNTKCWDGSDSGIWDDDDNWSPTGTPSGVDIIYPNFPNASATPPPYPIAGFSGTPYGTVQNLRVNHLAEVHIPQSTGLTVTGNVTLKGGPRNIICDAGVNAGTLSSAFIPEGSIDYSGYSLEDGHIEVHRTLYFENFAAGFYLHQVAAPVGNVILDDWDMIHFHSYAYEFNTILQDWWNIYVPSRSTPPGYGFILSLYNDSVPNFSTYEDVVFYDNLVETNLPVNFNGIDAGEWALIGNPYTAPVDWDLMYVGQTNILNTVWVWDPATGVYLEYVGGTGGNSSARNIQPGQSFFIEATGAASLFDIDRADRVQVIEPYLKDEYPNLLRIYTEGGNMTSDEVYIRFKEGEEVTAAYNEGHDGQEWPSMYGEFATELYTVSSDGVNLGIDARPMITEEPTSIPLHFKATTEAEYKLHVDEESVGTFPASVFIMLEDTFFPSQDWIDMRDDGYYTFDGSPEDDYGRFVLHFYDLEFGIEDGLTADPVKIYSDRTDAFIINSSEQLIKEILVYDITGNLMANKSMVNSAVTRIYVSDQTGYYVVRVITDKAVYSEKVLISK